MDLAAIIEAISSMTGAELGAIRKAVERRRERLAQGSGILQLEYRTNPKTGLLVIVPP